MQQQEMPIEVEETAGCFVHVWHQYGPRIGAKLGDLKGSTPAAAAPCPPSDRI
jgi:hypothetical protein